MIRLGLDVHGVIDRDHEFFSEVTKNLRYHSNEVIIITGRESCQELLDELVAYGIVYDDILSITSYQKALGTPISYLDNRKSQPVMEPKIWNPTKAALCASAGIDIMIDDSTIYEEFFRDIKTQYIIYTPAVKELLKTLFYTGGSRLL